MSIVGSSTCNGREEPDSERLISSSFHSLLALVVLVVLAFVVLALIVHALVVRSLLVLVVLARVVPDLVVLVVLVVQPSKDSNNSSLRSFI